MIQKRILEQVETNLINSEYMTSRLNNGGLSFKMETKLHYESSPPSERIFRDDCIPDEYCREGNKPIVKIRGLGPNYLYQVVEEPWSWAYTPEAITPTRTDQLITNPFKFKNTPKTDIDITIRHAESEATNDFSGTGSATDVDSTTTKRP